MIAADTLSFARSVAKDLDHAHLQKSDHIKHLSSGKKIVNSGDDVGALSVQMKQSGDLRRMQEVKHTLQNAKSYLQARDSALAAVHTIYDRMGTLATMAMDVTKTDQDREKYETEFQELRTAAWKYPVKNLTGSICSGTSPTPLLIKMPPSIGQTQRQKWMHSVPQILITLIILLPLPVSWNRLKLHFRSVRLASTLG